MGAQTCHYQAFLEKKLKIKWATLHMRLRDSQYQTRVSSQHYFRFHLAIIHVLHINICPSNYFQNMLGNIPQKWGVQWEPWALPCVTMGWNLPQPKPSPMPFFEDGGRGVRDQSNSDVLYSFEKAFKYILMCIQIEYELQFRCPRKLCCLYVVGCGSFWDNTQCLFGPTHYQRIFPLTGIFFLVSFQNLEVGSTLTIGMSSHSN